jgi:hypothetical protein
MKPKMMFLMWVSALFALVADCSAQNTVLDWNQIAATTIVTNGGKASVASSVWFAYEQIAVYDAVAAINHRFEPIYYRGKAPREASLDAAVIAAAHRVLALYFPAQAPALDTQYATSLAAVTDSSDAVSAGVKVGEAAAEALINARAGDGLEASVAYTPFTGPGFWQTTPPKFLPALTPWLGEMRPFVLETASQFLPDGPTSLDSAEWVHDYNEVRALGDLHSTVRTPAQTEIGLFWTEHTGMQYSRSFRNLARDNGLDVSESARMLAMLWTGFADAGIGCWNAKYHYSFWRPVTAIPVGGGNSRLTADPAWTPLGTTPNHPEYPAAHGCVTGSVSALIQDYFHRTNVHIVVDSKVTNTTHTFEHPSDLFDEVFSARMYAGFHYRHSLRDGGELGRDVARRVERRFCRHDE